MSAKYIVELSSQERDAIAVMLDYRPDRPQDNQIQILLRHLRPYSELYFENVSEVLRRRQGRPKTTLHLHSGCYWRETWPLQRRQRVHTAVPA